jgi:Arc-like DNA binding domain
MDYISQILGKKQKRFNFRMPKLMYETLRKDAENQGISIADILRDLVFERYGKVLINDAIVSLKHLKREGKRHGSNFDTRTNQGKEADKPIT